MRSVTIAVELVLTGCLLSAGSLEAIGVDSGVNGEYLEENSGELDERSPNGQHNKTITSLTPDTRAIVLKM